MSDKMRLFDLDVHLREAVKRLDEKVQTILMDQQKAQWQEYQKDPFGKRTPAASRPAGK